MSAEICIGLAIVGVIFILVEVFVPGGVVGALGAVILAVGIVGGFFHSLTFGLWLLLAALAIGLLIFWLWLRYFPRSPIGRRMILEQDASAWHGHAANQGLLGQRGTTHTPLHPAGVVLIDGRRVDVVTRGEMIAAGCPVEVVEIEGNRIVVAPVRPVAASAPVSAQERKGNP